jgi:hypothetical protein
MLGDFHLSPTQDIFFVLACWFFLGLGVLIGHFTWPRSTDTAEPPEVVSTVRDLPPVPNARRGAHHGPETGTFPAPVLEEPPSRPVRSPDPQLTGHLESPVNWRRRAEDRIPDVRPTPVPGGRRRSDGPAMTRRQVRELREKGWYSEDPASPKG